MKTSRQMIPCTVIHGFCFVCAKPVVAIAPGWETGEFTELMREIPPICVEHQHIFGSSPWINREEWDGFVHAPHE